MFFDYHIPTKILFGKGKLDELATVSLPGKKALIFITKGTAMAKFGYLERVQKLLGKNNVSSVVQTVQCPTDHLTFKAGKHRYIQLFSI